MKRKFIVLRSLAKSNITYSLPTFRRGITAGSKAASKKSVAKFRDKKVVEVERIDRKRATELSKNKEVIAVVPVMPMKLIEPFKGKLPTKIRQIKYTWGVEAVGAHTSRFDGSGITVAVLDTGINKKHPAFKGVRMITKDFTKEGIEDINGHGTHCAGTIFGRTVDGVRIGVAPGVTNVLIGKVLAENGGGSDWIAAGINWAVEEGADIISMSIGIDFPGYVEELTQKGMPVDLATSRALEEYRANVLLFDQLARYVSAKEGILKPVFLIAAAGNESKREKGNDYVISVSPPAVADGFISVGALGQAKTGWTIADFSNTNPTLCGPGVDILSADLKSGLDSMSGTSMAAPHVAGVAVLWAQKLSAAGMLNGKSLTTKLLGEATMIGIKTGTDNASIGFGMVQAPQPKKL